MGTGGTETGGSGGDGAGTGTGGTTAGGPAAGVGGGVSGASGRGSGGSAGKGGNGGKGGGAGAMSCEELESAYQKKLPDALACFPNIDTDQCTEHVPASLPCGCTVHVNPANEDALAELQRLQQQHGKMGCIVACPAVECLPSEGVCTTMGSGSQGRCTEQGGK
jgi:hypothetical protein